MLQKNLNAMIPRLALLSAFCFFIEIFRMLLTRNILFIFLPWNLILAWVPLWLAMQLKEDTKQPQLILYLALWLLFFPNAPYIITDFVHLRPRPDFPFWFDAMLLFSFAFTGLLLGIISALIVFKKMKGLFAAWKASGFMILAMILSGYGMYIGRFLRYNSWDLLTDPIQILSETASRLVHPATYPRTYGVTIMAGVLLSLVLFIFEPFLQAE